jgi:hypothetical protein
VYYAMAVFVNLQCSVYGLLTHYHLILCRLPQKRYLISFIIAISNQSYDIHVRALMRTILPSALYLFWNLKHLWHIVNSIVEWLHENDTHFEDYLSIICVIHVQWDLKWIKTLCWISLFCFKFEMLNRRLSLTAKFHEHSNLTSGFRVLFMFEWRLSFSYFF